MGVLADELVAAANDPVGRRMPRIFPPFAKSDPQPIQARSDKGDPGWTKLPLLECIQVGEARGNRTCEIPSGFLLNCAV